jgi:microcystin-dependent protein
MVYETDTYSVRIWDGTAWVGTTPAGAIETYAGATAPNGWLLCFGQAVSRTTYADLFAALSTTHGVGNGSTTFNLPDLRGRVPAGKDNMGGTSASRLITNVTGGTLGAAGGSESHTLSQAQMPSHTHTQNSHTHSGSGTGGLILQNGSGGTAANLTVGGGGYIQHTLTSTAPSIQSTGSDQSHNNTQPTIILNYIIKV